MSHFRFFNCVALALILACSGSALCEDKPDAAPKKDAPVAADYTYNGKVVKVEGGTITIHSFRGHSGIIRPVNTDDQTIIEVNGKVGKLTDFKAGEWVKISWSDNPKRTIKIESTMPPESALVGGRKG